MLPRYLVKDTFRLQMQKKRLVRATREFIYNESEEFSSEGHALNANKPCHLRVSHKGMYQCAGSTLHEC